MRNEIKKMQPVESADFLTGVGLYNEEEPKYVSYDCDDDALMRNLADTKFDDLE